MNTSNDELLAKIHKVSLYILLAFDKICREHNLTYFLDSGTALGAVRHGGFIPWDDDVDVGMPRKDYERFLQIAKENLPNEFFLQTRETDPAYERNAAKLRLKGTYIQEYEGSPYAYNGFFVDIFPFDNVSNNKYIAKWNIIVLSLIYRVIGSWWGRKTATSKFRGAVRNIIKIIPQSYIERMNDRYLRSCRKYENIDTGYMTCHHWGMTYMHCKAYIFDTKKLLPVKDIYFEGEPVRIMQDPDYYLKIMYGNYMELPPESKRYGHHLNGEIDFGEYA